MSDSSPWQTGFKQIERKQYEYNFIVGQKAI